jgi:hypothetical protein
VQNIDADPRNADWLRVLERAREFGGWTHEQIVAECEPSYEAYAETLRKRHRRWPNSPQSARHEVFPEHLSWLTTLLPPELWHDAWWAAKSSQTLALTLLAAACRSRPTLSWLPFADQLGRQRVGLFEVELAECVLNERPYQTRIDFLATGSDAVVAVEAKFSERGFARCKCNQRDEGICSARVNERPYWAVAGRELGLRQTAQRCPLSLAYQPVRNIAAAQAIAGRTRASAFVLLYDERNPYFAGSGRWPGWIVMLEGLTQHAQTRFTALPWQALITRADLDPETVQWAMDKHGLEPQAPA